MLGKDRRIGRGESRDVAGRNPMLEAFSSYELRAELRRRRREGGLVRWILWRLGEWV